MMSSAFVLSFAMRLLSAGLGFLVTVILSRLLSAAGFGPYALAMGLLGVATLFTTMGFQHFSVRAIPPLIVESQHRAVTGLVIFAFGVTSALALLAMLILPALTERLELYTDPAMTHAIVVTGLLFLPVTVNQVRQGIQRGLGRPLGAQLPDLVLQPMVLIALIGIATVCGWQLDAVRAIELTLLSLLIAGGVGFCLFVPAVKGHFLWPPVFFPFSWLLQARSSFYLFAATTIMSATDLLMLGHLSGAEETGIYGVAVRFHVLMLLPSLAVSSVLSHEVSRLNALGRKAELEVTARRSASQAAVVAIAIAFGCTIATFHFDKIFGVEFRAAALPVLILVWSRAAETLLGQPGVILANATFVGLCGIVVTFAASLNVILNALMIPRFGATGAATATAVAHLVMALLFAVLTLWKVKIVTLPFVTLPLLQDLLAEPRRKMNNILNYLRYIARIHLKYSRRPRRYRQLLRSVEHLRPRTILEVGVYQGKRGVEMIEAAMLSRPAGEIQYFGFDLFEKMTAGIMSDELSKWPNKKAEVTARLVKTGSVVKLHAGFTQYTLPAFVAAKPGRTIDFIFIDGGHAVDTIRSDWSSLLHLMHENTVVLFDDYYVDCPHLTEAFGCNKVVNDLDEEQFEWRILDDVDFFVHDGKQHNVAMVEVTRRKLSKPS